MASPVASASDVSDRIPTGLSEGQITTYLEDAVFDLEQEFDLSEKSDDWRTQVEWRLAAYKILVLRERETTREQRESATLTFDASRVEELKEEIRQLTDHKLLDEDEEQADFEVF